MISAFETAGIWRTVHGGLVKDWGNLPEFVPTELDVPFYFGLHYNYGQRAEERESFLREHNVRSVIEIAEIFRNPRADVDGGFKGRTLLVARFDNATNALYFRMAVPDPNESEAYRVSRDGL